MKYLLIIVSFLTIPQLCKSQDNIPTRISLNKEVLIRSTNYISSIDRIVKFGDGYALLDEAMRAVYFTDNEFKIVDTFNWGACHPGVEFQPLSLIPLAQDKLLVASRILGAYIYSKSDGTCSTRQAALVRFAPSPDMASTKNGVVVMRYQSAAVELMHYDQNLKIVATNYLQGRSEFSNMRSRFYAHQVLLSRGDIIMILNPFTAGVYEVSQTSSIFGTSKKLPLKRFQGPKSDLTETETNKGGLLEAFSNSLGTYDYVDGIYPASHLYFIASVLHSSTRKISVSACGYDYRQCSSLAEFDDERVINAFDRKLVTLKRLRGSDEGLLIKIYDIR